MLQLNKPSEETGKLRFYQRANLEQIPQLQNMSKGELNVLKAVSAVLPFRVNSYICDELIDWDDIPADPIYQLTFPQAGMLDEADLNHMLELVSGNASDEQIASRARQIQMKLNPHPAGQLDLNVPKMDNERVPGMQHKYRETVLFFPSPGQTCFAYCTYCFRWPQFVGINGLKFASKQVGNLVQYLTEHPEVRSVLFTGGDPLIMKTSMLRAYIEPLLNNPKLEHVNSIRIGTKSLAYWPQRFISDDDADDLLRLFEEVRASGRNLAFMAHCSHPRLMETEMARKAISRLEASGVVIRCQSPLIKHVNDSSEIWSRMWRLQVKLGLVPYYMFVERDTGAKNYFEVPLERCLEIFNEAYSQVSGLCRTVRGPSMSCTPGKVMVDGITEINGEKLFVLKFIQARDPSWVNKVFFAKYNPTATWIDHLEPAFGQKEFFWEAPLKQMKESGFAQVWLNK